MSALTAGDWIALGVAMITLMTAARGYLISPPFVARSELSRLERMNRDCEDRCRQLEGRILNLENEVRALRASEVFWQEEYRNLKEGKSQ